MDEHEFELYLIKLEIQSIQRLQSVHVPVCPGTKCKVCASLERQLARLYLEYEEKEKKS
jgi:hypothetical protein